MGGGCGVLCSERVWLRCGVMCGCGAVCCEVWCGVMSGCSCVVNVVRGVESCGVARGVVVVYMW